MYVGANNVMTQMAEDFAEEVRTNTNGSLEITVRPAGELPFSPTEVVRRIEDNSLAMGDAASSFIRSECPVATLPSLPFLLADHDEWASAWKEVLRDPINECLADFDARVVANYAYGPQMLFGSGDVPQQPSDFKGMQMRQLGPEYEPFFDEIGANVVSLTGPEVAGAIQTGIIDGAQTTASAVVGEGWDEYIDWVYAADIGMVPSYFLVSRSDYDGLPSETQEAFDSAATAWQDQLDETVPSEVDAALAELKKQGVEIVTPSEASRNQLIEPMGAYWEQWSAENGTEEILSELRTLFDR